MWGLGFTSLEPVPEDVLMLQHELGHQLSTGVGGLGFAVQGSSEQSTRPQQTKTELGLGGTPTYTFQFGHTHELGHKLSSEKRG